MGKICLPLNNLKDHPQLWGETLALIEKSFNYRPEHSFERDFITLMNRENAQHLYILQEDEKVIAHLGVKIRDININNKKVSIAMMGGIAVEEAYRGKGLFSYLMNEVKKIHHHQVAAFILWSDLPAMYEKHQFYLCGSQYPLSKRSEKNIFQHLTNASEEEKKKVQEIHQIFFQKHFAYIERSDEDWKQLFESKSSQIWVNNRNNINCYFVQHKGQDLQNIIHEYATVDNRTEFLKQISHWGEVWLTQDYFHEGNAHFQFLLAAGHHFSSLVDELTLGEVKISSYNNEECHFSFKGSDYVMSCSEFYSGIFGPGRFSEFNGHKDLFITGWDSI